MSDAVRVIRDPGHSESGFAGEVLGRFVAGSRWEDIDPALRHEAKRSLLNYFGGALGAVHDPAVRTALEVMQPFSGPDQVTVIGQTARLDVMGAAFVNAIAANLLDYDDTHLNTVIHPTAPVAPPILAVAEQRGLPGAAVLHAFILGAEVECRIGNAVSPGHYARGWHITSTCGVFGAAAACSKLLGLDAVQTGSALGIAASQSAGLVENLTTAAKNVGMGNAARNGLLAALFAQRGYEAAPAALEGKLGWARAMGDVPHLPEISGALGHRWEFRSNTYKPYPSGIVFHAVIEACFALRERLAIVAGDVAEVIVRGHQLLLDRGDRTVRTERDARVSIHHSVAVVLVRGRAGVAEFSADAVAEPAIVAMRDKVRAELDPVMQAGAASVTVRMRDGREETVDVDHPRGSAERPLSDAELEAKFHDNAALGGSAGQAAERIAAIWSMENAPNLAPLMRLMAARAV
jgi:2-methylcitrate dehydratase PrpD